ENVAAFPSLLAFVTDSTLIPVWAQSLYILCAFCCAADCGAVEHRRHWQRSPVLTGAVSAADCAVLARDWERGEEAAAMALYVMEPERRTLHGRFSRELEPVITITSGDTVRYRLLDAGWGLAAPSDTLGTRPRFGPRLEPRDYGHALCGPVAIEGAEPGMTLQVQIDVIEPGDYGITDAGGPGELNRQLGVPQD